VRIFDRQEKRLGLLNASYGTRNREARSRYISKLKFDIRAGLTNIVVFVDVFDGTNNDRKGSPQLQQFIYGVGSLDQRDLCYIHGELLDFVELVYKLQHHWILPLEFNSEAPPPFTMLFYPLKLEMRYTSHPYSLDLRTPLCI
jgi:hypothetical protein